MEINCSFDTLTFWADGCDPTEAGVSISVKLESFCGATDWATIVGGADLGAIGWSANELICPKIKTGIVNIINENLNNLCKQCPFRYLRTNILCVDKIPSLKETIWVILFYLYLTQKQPKTEISLK